MNRFLVVLCFLGSSLALANAEAKKELTFLSNGFWAASSTEVSLGLGIRKNSMVAPNLKINWQLFRFDAFLMTFGYGTVGIGGPSSYHGFSTEIWAPVAGDLRFGLEYLNGKGYMRRTTDKTATDDRTAVPIDVVELGLKGEYLYDDGFYLMAGLASRSFSFNNQDGPKEESGVRKASVVVGVRSSRY